ncbi:MAG: hypothetical protein ACR2P1_03605 [Pseudomonadales bacterium]
MGALISDCERYRYWLTRPVKTMLLEKGPFFVACGMFKTLLVLSMITGLRRWLVIIQISFARGEQWNGAGKSGEKISFNEAQLWGYALVFGHYKNWSAETPVLFKIKSTTGEVEL